MITIKTEKKILIVSRSNDPFCKQLKKWLVALNEEFVSLNFDTMVFEISNMEVINESFSFLIDNSEYSIEEFKTIYFFRGALTLTEYTGKKEYLEKVRDFNSAFRYYRMAYEVSIKEIVHELIHNEKTIGRDNGGRINKTKMLKLANESGLKIPDTLITTKKSELSNFLKEHKDIITKCLDMNIIFRDPNTNELLHGLTSKLEEQDVLPLPKFFPLSIFQKNIVKLVELRIFFIEDLNFVSAIFSQNSNHTLQDYRNYDDDYPNRVLPFQLPKDIVEKLEHFKQKAQLKTGSIDMILSHDHEYYFLEVNPQGQFMAVSEDCNYNLDLEVAKN